MRFSNFLYPWGQSTSSASRGDCRGGTRVVKTTSTAGAAGGFFFGSASAASGGNGKSPLIVVQYMGKSPKKQ